MAFSREKYFKMEKKMINILKQNRFIFYVYLITLLTIVVISIKIKPFGNPDEGAHFLRAYEVSKGHFINRKEDVGINISCKDYEIIAKKYNPIAFEQQYNKENINDENCYVISKNSAGAYSPIPYSFISIGFILSDMMNLNIEDKLIFSRIFNGVICLTFIFFIIMNCNYYKYIFTFVIITPMFLVTTSSISADTFLFVTIFAYLSLIIQLLENKKMDISYMSLLLISFLLGSSKIIYATISLLSIVTIRVKNFKKHNLFVLLSIFIAFITSFFFTIIADSSLIYLGNGAIPAEQFNFILNNIINYIVLAVNSVFDFNVLRNLFYPNYLFGEFYFLLILYPILFTILILSENVIISSLLERFYVVILCFGVVLLISISLSMFYNPPGYKNILGLQARYFLPLLIVLPLALSLPKYLFYVSTSIKKLFIILVLVVNVYLIFKL